MTRIRILISTLALPAIATIAGAQAPSSNSSAKVEDFRRKGWTFRSSTHSSKRCRRRMRSIARAMAARRGRCAITARRGIRSKLELRSLGQFRRV